MTMRGINLWCWTLAIMLAAAAVISVIAAIRMPYDLDSDSRTERSAVSDRAGPAARARLTMQDFEPYLSNALRTQVQMPLPTTRTIDDRPEPPSSNGSLQLIGTITEADNNYAVFRTPDGIELKRVGENIEGSRLVTITDGSAEMSQPNGQPLTMRVPQPPGQ